MGSLIVSLAVAWTISLFAFRRMPPHQRAIFTAGAAWLVCAAIWGFILPSGFYGGMVGFSLGAVVVGVERYIHYSKHWSDDPETSDLTDKFS